MDKISHCPTTTRSSSMSHSYLTARKTGTCSSGAERNRGRVTHLIAAPDPKNGGPYFGRALCGTTPGPRSAGWEITRGADVTCTECDARSPDTKAAIEESNRVARIRERHRAD